jgi:hypothetical protein
MASFKAFTRLLTDALAEIIPKGGLTAANVLALCRKYIAEAGYTAEELLNTPTVHRLVHYAITGTDLKGEWPSDNSKPTWAMSSVALTAATRAHHATTGRFAVMKFDPITGEFIITTEMTMPMTFPTAFDAWSSIDACWSVLFATHLSILTAALEVATEEAREAQAQAVQAQAQAQADQDAMTFAVLAGPAGFWPAIEFARAFPEAAAFGRAAADVFPGIDPVMCAIVYTAAQGLKDPQDGKKGDRTARALAEAIVEETTVSHGEVVSTIYGPHTGLSY